MSKSKDDGRMMCIQCQNEDLSKMFSGGEEGHQSLDPVLGAKGHWGCIYHGELHESQMIFVPFADDSERVQYLAHEDRVLKKLGMGKYAYQGNTVTSQHEVLSRMEEIKPEPSNDIAQQEKLDTSSKTNNTKIFVIIYLILMLLIVIFFGKQWENIEYFIDKLECSMTKEDVSSLARKNDLELEIHTDNNDAAVIYKEKDYLYVIYNSNDRIADILIPKWPVSILGFIAGNPSEHFTIKSCD